MSKNSVNAKKKTGPTQFRIPNDENGTELAGKLDKIAKKNGLSLNDVCNLALAAGLPIVETKMDEIRNPLPQAA